MIILLVILCLILFSLLIVSLYFNWRHGTIILEMQDAVESCLDDLDAIYGRIGQILDKPVFFDSIEIRQVIADIDDARQTVLKVANVLVMSVVSKEDSDA